jgi:hypothetical protein
MVDAKELVENSGLGFQFNHAKIDEIVQFFIKMTSEVEALRVTPNRSLIESKSFDKLSDQLVSVFDQLNS